MDLKENKKRKLCLKNIVFAIMTNLFFLPMIGLLIYTGVSDGWSFWGWILMLILIIGPFAVGDIIVTYTIFKKTPSKRDNSDARNFNSRPATSSTSVKSSSGETNKKAKNDKSEVQDDTQAVILADGLFDRMISLKLEKYLTRTYTPFTSIVPEDFQSNERMSQKCNSIFGDILNYLYLKPIPLSVIISDNGKKGAKNEKEMAGRFSTSGPLGSHKQIQITVKKSYSSDNIIAILCHESTHLFMDIYRLKSQIEEINECRTDVLAIILGFGEILNKGYTESEWYSYCGNTTTKHSAKLGYITAYDCRCVMNFVAKRRAKLLRDMEQEKKRQKKSAENKEKLFKMIQTAETFDTMFYDLLNNANAEKIKSTQTIIYEYENLEFKKRLIQWKAAMEVDSDLSKTESAISQCTEFCEKMLYWINFLQS